MRKTERGLYRNLWLLVCIGAMLFFAPRNSLARHNYLGFAPAYPTGSSERFVPPSNPPYLTYERSFEIHLRLDKEGQVLDVPPACAADSLIARYVRDYLRNHDFEPAQFAGRRVDSRLPVRVTLRPGRKYPDFSFPVDSTGQIGDRQHYLDACRLNEVYPPQLETFPRYFGNIQPFDTVGLYPFVLLRLTLDTAGRPTSVNEVLSTFPAYTLTSKSAAIWADYKPARVGGEAVASDCFLLICYFPQINYPTEPWQREQLDSLIPLHRARVQLIPDTVALMQKPLPRKMPGNEFNVGGHSIGVIDTISIHMVVDSSGETGFRRFSKTTQPQHRVVRQLVNQLSFYPALDYQGRPQYYSGLVRIAFAGSKKIRIDYVW